MLLIDLERFSAINNTLGAASGDEVLREVARAAATRRFEGTLAARLGGDEYAMLCPRGATSGRAARWRDRRCCARLEAPVALDGVALDVEASVGVAVLGEHADDPGVLLQRADLALAPRPLARQPGWRSTPRAVRALGRRAG